MKNTKNLNLKGLLIGATFALGLSACTKFLQEAPTGYRLSENFFKTENDAADAVTAVYYLLNAGGNAVQTPYNTLFNTGLNFMADDEFPGPGATNPDVRSMANLLHTSTNLRVFELWQQHYAAVYKANLAIANIPNITFSNNTLKNRYIAEAKFLRALWYFNLVRLYGDVPLVTTPVTGITSTDFQGTRTPSAQIYAQIEQDLKDASKVLPKTYSSADAGRATKGAALALLSKVYLTKAGFPLQLDPATNYALANSYADSVYNLNVYSLQSNYATVFLPANKNGTETIFAAQFKSGTGASTYLTQGNNQNPRSIKTGVPGVAGSYADQTWFYTKGTDKFFSVYKLYAKKTVGTVTGVAVDKRRDVTFVTAFRGSDSKLYGALNDPKIITGSKLDSVPYFNKTWDPSVTSNTSQSAANVHIVRFADVILIKAEALNELGNQAGAYTELKKIRSRAGLGVGSDGSLADGFNDQNALRDSIYLDRRLEFVFEYQRWFDLVRQRDASGNNIFVKSLQAVSKINAADKHRFHPIPQNEINLNPKLTQNPGY
jgi:starch-binding outer membrane protein, SusD/RagB family